MKTFVLKNRASLFALFAMIGLSSCNKDDGPTLDPSPETVESHRPVIEGSSETNSIFGKWEIIEGTGEFRNTKYMVIGKDSTLSFFDEDTFGFKREYSFGIDITANEITYPHGGGGSVVNTYTIKGDTLTYTPSYGEGPISLKRTNSAPETGMWVKPMTALLEHLAPGTRRNDIAFDGAYLVAFDDVTREIIKIDTENFSPVERLTTPYSAYAVEIEKSDSDLKQLFQSHNGSDKFHSFIYRSNEPYFDSETLGSWITGLASINPGNLWVASSSEEALYRYKTNGALSPGEILETIKLDFEPEGLDYQEGYLYVSDGHNIHKCLPTSEFRAVESYKLPRYSISGIAFDGTHFWLSANNREEDQRVLVKVAFPE